MAKQVLFIHGAGQGAYEEDKKLVASLQQELGSEYKVAYPVMPNEDDPRYDDWKQCIEKELGEIQGSVVLVGHSMGGSVFIKCMTEIKVDKPVAGIFLISSPFWGGGGWQYEGYEELALSEDAAAKLPEAARIFLYHSRDDEIVPFDHLALHAETLPQATIREIDKGGHQLGNDLSLVAKDIKSLE